jgi:hypothetical protein
MAMQEPCTSSGSLAVGTTAVLAKPGLLHSVILNPGSAASTITVYDNASAASGTVLASLVAAASTSSVSVSFNSPIYSVNGLTVVVAGTAATGIVGYTKSY